MGIDQGYVFLALAGIGAFFMAFCNGANDVANAFASAVGAKAIKTKQALLIASIVTFLGAVFLGGEVVAFLIEGLAPPSMFEKADEYIVAMLAVLASSSLFIFLSTLKGMPVSCTHAIVGGLTGVAIYVEGWAAVHWNKLLLIALSWVFAPLLTGLFAWALAFSIRKFIIGNGGPGTLKRVRRALPALVSIATSGAILGIMSYPSLKARIGAEDWLIVAISLALLVPTYVQSKALVKRWLKKKADNEQGAEQAFKRLQVATSAYVAFGIGANDVSNSISPVFAIYLMVKQGGLVTDFQNTAIPFWILALGGVGIATGIAFLGKRVMKTLGKKITQLTHSRGFSIDFSVASVVVGASFMGLSVSTTQAATGAIVGAGLSTGEPKSIHFDVIGKILITWIITVPTAAFLAVIIYKGLAMVLI